MSTFNVEPGSASAATEPAREYLPVSDAERSMVSSMSTSLLTVIALAAIVGLIYLLLAA
jgi:hypothetical protein